MPISAWWASLELLHVASFALLHEFRPALHHHPRGLDRRALRMARVSHGQLIHLQTRDRAHANDHGWQPNEAPLAQQLQVSW